MHVGDHHGPQVVLSGQVVREAVDEWVQSELVFSGCTGESIKNRRRRRLPAPQEGSYKCKKKERN